MQNERSERQRIQARGTGGDGAVGRDRLLIGARPEAQLGGQMRRHRHQRGTGIEQEVHRPAIDRARKEIVPISAALEHQFGSGCDLQVAVRIVARLQAVLEIQIEHAQHQQAGDQCHAASKRAVRVL